MKPGNFTLTLLDIPDVERGVGLCVVLQTPGGTTWLYDTGTGYPAGGGWHADCNTGRDQIAPFLQERGTEALDGVVISHAHYDHFGGLLWLAEHVEIKRLVDTGYEFTGTRDAHYDTELADYDRLRDRFRDAGRYTAAVAGDTLDLDPALQVEVIAPPAEYFQPNPAAEHADWNPAAHFMLNTNSLMLRVRHGSLTYLLPGDIEKQDQDVQLLPRVGADKLACDILIAPGHGLHTAQRFPEATRPQVTLVSLFPRWLSSCTALEGFGRVGSEVLVTGVEGDLTVTSDGQEFAVVAARTGRRVTGCAR